MWLGRGSVCVRASLSSCLFTSLSACSIGWIHRLYFRLSVCRCFSYLVCHPWECCSAACLLLCLPSCMSLSMGRCFCLCLWCSVLQFTYSLCLAPFPALAFTTGVLWEGCNIYGRVEEHVIFNLKRVVTEIKQVDGNFTEYQINYRFCTGNEGGISLVHIDLAYT